MNRTLGVQLAGYAVALIGLSFLLQSLLPGLGRTTLITACIGGALCLVWAARVIKAEHKSKLLPLLTLIPICYVLLGQVILVWSEARDRLGGAVLLTLLFFMSLGMVMRIAYAGMFTQERPGEPERKLAANPSVGRQSGARA